MATNTFERKIELKDYAAVKNLLAVMTNDNVKPLKVKPFSDVERKRSEELLNRSLLRSQG